MTPRKQLPSVDELHALFRYEDGKLYWRANQAGGPRAGSYAGCYNNMGYYTIQINRKKLRAHRIIWKMHKGTEPAHLDHIDHDKTNNRIENLRECTHAQNIQNSRRKVGASGVRGVRFHNGMWEARVEYCGVRDCKYFLAMDAAIAWVKARRAEMHGEFAYHGEAIVSQ